MNFRDNRFRSEKNNQLYFIKQNDSLQLEKIVFSRTAERKIETKLKAMAESMQTHNTK